MNDEFSANVDDLDGFSQASATQVVALSTAWSELRADRDLLATSPLPAFVETTTLDRYRELVELMAETGRFVTDISEALCDVGDHTGSSRYVGSAAAVAAELARTTDERLDRLEADLVAAGVESVEAGKVRSEVEVVLAADPTIGFGEATRRGLAAYRGGSRSKRPTGPCGPSLCRRPRSLRRWASTLTTSSVDTATGITLDDLHRVIDDPDAPPELRDAAYRVAADGILHANLDTALQTDLSAEPLTGGFAWNKADGIIGLDDVIVFPVRDHQARVLRAWHPLVDTAGQAYALGRLDSHVSADDVKVFVADADIPVYVRLAVFDVYAERHELDLDQRTAIDQELAFDATGFVGGTTVSKASGRPAGGGSPGLVPPGGSRAAPRRGAPSGGAAVPQWRRWWLKCWWPAPSSGGSRVAWPRSSGTVSPRSCTLTPSPGGTSSSTPPSSPT